MRLIGSLLMLLGALVGALVGVGLLVGLPLPGVSWILVVGLVKLTLLGSLGMMAAGAVLHRLARRADDRARLPGPREHSTALTGQDTTSHFNNS